MSRRHFWRDARGTEIAELAAVLPLLFMVLLIIFWFARAFNIHAAVTRAAQEGAKVAAVSSCATCAAQTIAAQNTAIDTSVTDTLRAAGLDPANVTPYPAALPTFCTSNTWAPGGCTTTAGQVRVCRGVLLNPGALGNAQECGVMVGFQYPYRFNVPTVDANPPFLHSELYDLGMKAEVQNRVDYLCWQSSGC